MVEELLNYLRIFGCRYVLFFRNLLNRFANLPSLKLYVGTLWRMISVFNVYLAMLNLRLYNAGMKVNLLH